MNVLFGNKSKFMKKLTKNNTNKKLLYSVIRKKDIICRSLSAGTQHTYAAGKIGIIIVIANKISEAFKCDIAC